MFHKIIPIEKLKYHSKLTKEELFIQLQTEVEIEKPFKFGDINASYSKSYIGKIYKDSFVIKRAINYRNSFLPIIKGTIKEDNNGTYIYVKMELHELIKVFMIIWCGGILLSCFATIYSLINENRADSENGIFMFLPFLMLLVGILMTIIGFKTESKKSIKDMEKLLVAKLIEN